MTLNAYSEEQQNVEFLKQHSNLVAINLKKIYGIIWKLHGNHKAKSVVDPQKIIRKASKYNSKER